MDVAALHLTRGPNQSMTGQVSEQKVWFVFYSSVWFHGKRRGHFHMLQDFLQGTTQLLGQDIELSSQTSLLPALCQLLKASVTTVTSTWMQEQSWRCYLLCRSGIANSAALIQPAKGRKSGVRSWLSSLSREKATVRKGTTFKFSRMGHCTKKKEGFERKIKE